MGLLADVFVCIWGLLGDHEGLEGDLKEGRGRQEGVGEYGGVRICNVRG